MKRLKLFILALMNLCLPLILMNMIRSLLSLYTSIDNYTFIMDIIILVYITPLVFNLFIYTGLKVEDEMYLYYGKDRYLFYSDIYYWKTVLLMYVPILNLILFSVIVYRPIKELTKIVVTKFRLKK